METQGTHSCEFEGSSLHISAVHRQLSRILAAPLFAKSKQLRLLLEFLVDQALKGSAGHVKEYSIAVEVFGRDISFDPTIDNIVRVEARRLRSRLDKYYGSLGWSDSIQIRIPKGSYAPEFLRRSLLPSDAKGQVLAGHRITACLMHTPDGMLFQSIDTRLNRPSWLWLSQPIEDVPAREAALDFARRVATIAHPNVCSIQDAGEFSERVYITFVPPLGTFVSERLRQGPFSLEEATKTSSGIVRALQAVHEAGLVWGSLRPQYVVWDSASGNSAVMFMAISSSSASGDSARSPEQRVGGLADARSDVWAVGATLDKLIDRAGEPSVARAALIEVADRCLEVDPVSRYQSAGELAAALSFVRVDNRIEGAKPRPKIQWRRWAAALVLLTVPFISRSRSSGLGETRVAVLPFENLSGNRNDEPYTRAVAELIAARLAHIPSVHLVSSASLGLPGAEQRSAKFLREKLGVDYAVDGTLVKSNAQFQATVRLTRVADGTYEWSEDYSGAWGDVFDVFNKLADRASQSMGIVAHAQRRTQSDTPSTSVLAYDELLKGRFSAIEYWNTSMPRLFDDAERRLKRALELKPEYADAMVELAQLYQSAAYKRLNDQAQLFASAEGSVDRALAIDPRNAEAHSVRGGIDVDTGRPREALPHLLLAMQLKPSDPNPHNNLALAYEAMGFWEASLVERRRAVERDPLLRGIATGGMPLMVRLGRLTEAFRIVDSLDENNPERDIRLAYIHLYSGDPHKAEEILTQKTSGQPPERASLFAPYLALAQAMQGRRDVARRALELIPKGPRNRGDHVILLCALAGDRNRLMGQLVNNAFVRNYRWLTAQGVLRPYRKYPEFQRLARELYLEWGRNLAELGSNLPEQPPKLPALEEYLRED